MNRISAWFRKLITCGWSVISGGFSPAFLYLPVGIFWVWFLFLYASKPKETMAGCLECPEAFVWAAFGVSLVAGMLGICGKPSCLRCRIAGIALLSILASALLMVAVFHYRFVFAVFFIALIAIGIAYLRQGMRTSRDDAEREKIKGSLSHFLMPIAVILAAFFVAFMVDAAEFRRSWVDIQIAGNIVANMSDTAHIDLETPLVTKAMFSILGLAAYIIIGGGAMTWETLLPRSKSE